MNFLYSNVDSNFTCNQNDHAYINTFPRQSQNLPNFSTNHPTTSFVGQHNISNHNKEAYSPSMMIPQFYHQYHSGYSQQLNFLPDQLAQHFIVPSHGQHTIKYLTNCQPLNFQGAIVNNVNQQPPSQNYFYGMPSPEVTYPANFLPHVPISNQLQMQLSTSDVVSLDRVQSSTARVSKRIPIVNPITNEEIKIESLLSHNSMLKLDGCENVNSLTHVALCTVNKEHHEVEISQSNKSLTMSSFHEDVNNDLVFNSSQLSIVNVVSETSELDVVDSVVLIRTDMNEENTTSAESMTSNICAQKEISIEDNGHTSVNTDNEEIKVKEKRKYKYDRDFLYSLKTKGAVVQNLKLYFNVPREILVTSSLSQDILPSYPMCETSHYVQSASPNQRVIEIHRDKVELHKAEEAYKVVKKMDHGKENASTKSDLEREMRSVLNKITPENFDICFQLIVDMNVETQEDLKTFINILFEKATLEEYYAVTFAKLCNRLTFLSTNKHDSPPQHPTYANFRALLLQKCQFTFQTKLQVLMANERDQWRVKVNAVSDEKKKMQLEEYMEEKVKKVKDRFYGNIKFIGELFVQKLLNNQIIESCVENLLTVCDTQSLECLCKLLTIVGFQLDKVSPSRMDHFFNNINRLIAEKDYRVDARIRCKLMDVCEMRQNGWQLRQRQQMLRIMPMTKKEFELAEKNIQLQNETEIFELKKQTKQFSQHHHRSVVYPMDASKMVLKQCSDGKVDNLVLEPAGGGWKAGLCKKRLPQAEKNSSSPLTKQKIIVKEFQKSSGGGPSDELDYTRGKFVEKSMFENLYDLEGTNEDEEDKDQKFKIKCLNLWQKFVDTADEENTLHCFEELRDQPDVHKFVFYVVEKALDCKKELRIKGGQLFLLLLKKKMIDENIMVEGFFPVLQSAEDTLIDTPDLWCYLAHILFPLVNVNINLSFMNRLLSPLAKLNDGCVRARVLSHVVHLSSIELGKDIVKIIFETSGLCWSDFLDGVNENDFLCKEGLEYMLMNGVDCKANPMGSDKLYELFLTLLNRTMSTEKVSNLVEKELAAQNLDANAKEVVCALLRTIVVQSFINDEFHVDFIRERASLITKLADVQFNLSHCLLDTAYMTMVRQSSTVREVRNLLDALLQCNVISEEALSTWRRDVIRD